jgi:hypothetical protein
MYNTFFKDGSVIVQAQLLLYLIKSRNLKEATSLLSIQKSTKDTKVKHNVFEDITSVLKKYVNVASRVIQTTVVSSSNIKDHLTHHMENVMGTISLYFCLGLSKKPLS